MTDRHDDLFFALTPDRVLDAVEHAGLRCNPLCYPLNSFENRVYEVELEDRSRVIAKFYRPGRWSRAQILEEHGFLRDLAMAEVPVCPTQLFPDGETLKEIDGILYCLFERRGGRSPDEMTPEYAKRLGMLAARIHNVGAGRQVEHRIQINADTYVRQPLAWLEENQVLPLEVAQRYRVACNQLAELADARLQDLAVQQIHGDFHAGNVLERDGVFHVLDFDDSVIGPAVQDLWLLFPSNDPESLHLRELFIEGYEQLRAFDRRALNAIEALRGMRLVNYSAWLARRWHDPIFPATWPHFGTLDYWDEATRDLEEVVRHLERGGGAVASGDVVENAAEAEEERGGEVPLTNKDFFWDWDS